MPFRSRNDVLNRTSDGRNVVLQENLEFVSAGYSGGDDFERFRAPIGATSDGISTPKELWLKFPPFGPWWLGGVIHDSAYRGTLQVYTLKGVLDPTESARRKVEDLEKQLQQAKEELAAFELSTGIWKVAMLSKDRSDNLFHEVMDSCGVGKIDRDIIYEGVHLAGEHSFEDDRNELEHSKQQ